MNPAVSTRSLPRHIDVLIVGAGFAGIGLGVLLQRRGTESYLILERSDRVGGTWRDNRYPGAACDIPSHLYSYSFRPDPGWSRLYAPGPEILDYLRTTVDEEGLTDHLALGVEMLSARWEASAEQWIVETTAGVVTAAMLVLACGRLTHPNMPAEDRLRRFRGPVMHSSQWRDDVDVRGRVAVVGSGASAVQIVPRLTERAESVVMVQRSAAWVVPRHDREHPLAERTLFARDRLELERFRSTLFWRAEEGFAARAEASAARDDLRRIALDHLHRQVRDDRLRRELTPSYEIGCKRVLLSDDFYPALTRDTTTLVPSALAELDETGIVTVDGRHHAVDTVVFATGFHAARQPYAARIVGSGGESLDEHWSEGMVSYASVVVAGFPNLFVLNGPNASLGHNSAVYMIETQIGYVLEALAHRERHPGPLEVRRDAEEAYTHAIDAAAETTVWMTGGCDSWYVDPASRRLTLLWPDSASAYRREFGHFSPDPYHSPEPSARSASQTPLEVR